MVVKAKVQVQVQVQVKKLTGAAHLGEMTAARASLRRKPNPNLLHGVRSFVG